MTRITWRVYADTIMPSAHNDVVISKKPFRKLSSVRNTNGNARDPNLMSFQDSGGEIVKPALRPSVGAAEWYLMTPSPFRAFACHASRSTDAASSVGVDEWFALAVAISQEMKRWRNAKMALRWTAVGMMEVAKGFGRLKAYKQLPALKATLLAHQSERAIRRLEANQQAA
jgi:hypothetical protein